MCRATELGQLAEISAQRTGSEMCRKGLAYFARDRVCFSRPPAASVGPLEFSDGPGGLHVLE